MPREETRRSRIGHSPPWPLRPQPTSGSHALPRARLRWSKVEPKPLEPIGLHEARHTFASLAIAAGVNAKALTTYMGHSSIGVTYDRYGHLMAWNEKQTAALLDEYLAASTVVAP